MALARARAASRRVKDRWKAKKTYKVIAPAAFSNKILADTLADEPEKLMGRRVETTLFELTGDMKQMHVKLFFQVTDVQDTNAKTRFDGHSVTSDYMRRLTRRGASKISGVFDLKTNDGSRIRVKPFAITDRRCQTSQAQEIRRMMQAMLQESAENHSLAGFLADFLVGDLVARILRDVRKIHPVRRIEIAKTEMLRAPTIEVDETPLFALADNDDEDEEVEDLTDDSEE